jgi:hypothetical protein
MFLVKIVVSLVPRRLPQASDLHLDLSTTLRPRSPRLGQGRILSQLLGRRSVSQALRKPLALAQLSVGYCQLFRTYN